MLADKTTDPTQANAEAQMAFARSRLPVPSALEMSTWSTRSAASMNDVDTDERRHTMAIESWPLTFVNIRVFFSPMARSTRPDLTADPP